MWAEATGLAGKSGVSWMYANGTYYCGAVISSDVRMSTDTNIANKCCVRRILFITLRNGQMKTLYMDPKWTRYEGSVNGLSVLTQLENRRTYLSVVTTEQYRLTTEGKARGFCIDGATSRKREGTK